MQVDEELVNRCLVLTVDETNPQTAAILSRQRDSHTFDVKQADFVRDAIRKLHQNAQRLLKPLHVFNPFAPQLSFPSYKTPASRTSTSSVTILRSPTASLAKSWVAAWMNWLRKPGTC